MILMVGSSHPDRQLVRTDTWYVFQWISWHHGGGFVDIRHTSSVAMSTWVSYSWIRTNL